MAKMILSDSSPKNRRRMVIASGGYEKTSESSVTKTALPTSTTAYLPITKNAQYAGTGATVAITQPMFFSPLHTPQNWQIASRRREIYQWARFYYSNEPKVAAGVDFYSEFPLNGFKLECKNRKILKHYENFVKEIELSKKLNEISHEYFLIGDVFPFLEIDCPVCKGKGTDEDGEPCKHPDGTFRDIKILNPDYIEVKDNPLAKKPKFYLVPDEELRMMVARREPKEIYESMPQEILDLVAKGQPIPLSDRCISHMKYNASAYGTYGSSMLQRLFTMLAYKTKMMTANWIVAERMILPVRVVKVGEKDRPATSEDLADIVTQLSAVANDPNLTIVTHHAFDMDWIGATGRIHNINAEIEAVGKEILDGLMLNQAILNGDAASYSCMDEQTFTLTDSGFKSYKDITEEDKIACYNPEIEEIKYCSYYQKYIYDYDGEMIHFEGKRLDIMVTPNHRMLTSWDLEKWKVVEAEQVKNGMRFIGKALYHSKKAKIQHQKVNQYCNAVINSGLDINNKYDDDDKTLKININNKEINLEDFLSFAGFYLSEGSLTSKKTNYRLIIYQNKDRYFDEIKNCLDNLGFTYKIYEYGDERRFFIYNKALVSYMLEQFGHGAANKSIPSWIKNLPVDYLEVLIHTMLLGDGYKKETKIDSYTYSTVSENLASDFQEICFKCGYSTRKYKDKPCISSFGNKDLYRIHISKGKNSNGSFPIVRYKNIKREYYKGKVYCFSVPNGFFVTRRNGKITIQGNSAQVGVEVLIRRLENWRNKLKDWIEKHIFLPIAMMQGFIDEEESKDLKKTIYLYPRIVWNDLQLRDKTNKINILIQLWDKGAVSAQTVLEELELDYDEEIQKIRDEQVMASATGMLPSAQAGGPLGAGGMGGGMGGGMPGGEMGGMPGAGAETGGMPGGGAEMGGGGMAGGMGGAAGGAPMGAAAETQLPRIGKRGEKGFEKEEPPPSKMIKLTKLEQKMYKMLQGLNVPYPLFGQYSVRVPGEKQPFLLDFAYPRIGVGIESDGEVWHERDDFIQRDQLRDQKLANVGWRILRFKEGAIEDHFDTVKDIISKNIMEAAKALKKRSSDASMKKYASVDEYIEDNKENIGIKVSDVNGIAYLILIGTKVSE